VDIKPVLVGQDIQGIWYQGWHYFNYKRKSCPNYFRHRQSNTAGHGN